MKSTFTPRGVCSRRIDVDIEAGMVKSVKFYGGCDGNLQALSRFVEGMSAADAISRLRGIDCAGKGTSCPDQLARALESASGQPK